MPEYIEREALIEFVKQNTPHFDGETTMECVERSIRYAPTADVAEVVRCKDCIHSDFIKSCSKYECRKGCGTLKYSTDFCSYGERKGG